MVAGRIASRSKIRTIQIIVTTDVGPRVVSCGFKGKENLFYNNPAEIGTSGAKEYVGYGGHRLWAAPELAKRTYYPDNFPVEVKTLSDGVIADISYGNDHRYPEIHGNSHG